METISQTPCRILVFNPLKKLVAICGSFAGASKMLKISHQSILSACKGTTVSANGLYFRYLQDDIEVTTDDLGKLRVQEYDELCGVRRKVYRTKRMSRVGAKYRKKGGADGGAPAERTR